MDQLSYFGCKNVLLLMDNHISHKYYFVLGFSWVNNVVFLSFPPHTTNTLQPLNIAQEINTFQKAHPGRIVNQLDIARLVIPAFLKSALAKNAVNRFSLTGLWPFYRNILEKNILHQLPSQIVPLLSTSQLQTRIELPVLQTHRSSFLKTRRHSPRKQVHFSCGQSSPMRLGTKKAKENVTGQRYLQAPHKRKPKKCIILRAYNDSMQQEGIF
ncbi:hypothetical protein PR048_004613 [Dryococelus australis]|uniref:DDE-1 domain-containing protein n=1 Tax=Dryococelus australis TaxID=614101 RepID=A0ABQ9I5W3_9NEOP|nr:hypothetical protein PR048_004613 [Dryococelus australis]